MRNDLHSGFKIAELIVKRLEEKLTDEEEQYLTEWKHDREENRVLFHKLSQNPEKQFLKRESKLEKACSNITGSPTISFGKSSNRMTMV